MLAFPTPDGPLLAVFAARVPYRLTIGLLGYAVLFAAVLAAGYYGRLREREVAAEALKRQLAEARLDALRMQLNPHFLFNAMNTIAMLVRRGDRTEAVEMLAGLSGLLRQSLAESPPQETALRHELAFVERYLESGFASPTGSGWRSTSIRRCSTRPSRRCSSSLWSRTRSATALPGRRRAA